MNHTNAKLLVETMTPIANGEAKKVVNYTFKETIDYTPEEKETAQKMVKYARKYLKPEV
jgi:hypothetical protein